MFYNEAAAKEEKIDRFTVHNSCASCTERAGDWRGAAAKRTAPNKPVNTIGCNPTVPTARALAFSLPHPEKTQQLKHNR